MKSDSMDLNDVKENEKEKRIEQMREYALQNLFTSKAKQRLTNIKLVNEQKFNRVVGIVMKMAQNNDLSSQVTDKELKQLLYKMKQDESKDFNIRRK